MQRTAALQVQINSGGVCEKVRACTYVCVRGGGGELGGGV